MISDVASCALVLAFALLAPDAVLLLARPAERALARWAERPRLAVLRCGALALAVNAALTLARHPVPRAPDEFCYLLAADTYGSGRMTNATPPCREHFETYHIIEEPTYQAKYPPAQGLALALGRRLAGDAIAGAWLALAAAAAATSWMLQAWLPARWALAGGLLAALHPVLALAWGQSYWGGSLAWLGAALVFGALRRAPEARTGLACGAGLALLANSRPYEGLVATLPAGVALASALVRGLRARDPRPALRCGLVLAGVLAAAAAGMLAYDAAVTGDALKLPYQVWLETYSRHTLGSTLFSFLSKGEAARHPRLPLPVPVTFPPGQKVAMTVGQLAGSPGAVLVLALGCVAAARRRGRWRFALGTVALGLTAFALQNGPKLMHYVAPLVPLLIGCGVMGLRAMRAWRPRGRPVGRALAAGFVLVLAFDAGAAVARHLRAPADWAERRARIASELSTSPDRHLVIVHYAPGHAVEREWVYNAADIEGARVVWARSLGAAEDARLRERFAGRTVWRLDADADVPVPRRAD